MSLLRENVSLPEEDYRAVLDVITRLLSHKTTRSLARLFRSHILPLLDASTCFYAWADSDLLRPQIIDAVGIPQTDLKDIQSYLRCCPLARHMFDRGSLVGTYDLDIPRRDLQPSVVKFFGAHPARNPRGSSYLDYISTTLLTIDLSEPAIVVGFHRLDPRRETFTGREKQILEFLHPHLCPAIRTLVLEEGLNQGAGGTQDDPFESQIPMVQVTRDSKIVDQNLLFGKLFRSQPGDSLGSSLTRFLKRRITEYEKPENTRTSNTETFWYCRCPNVFQVDISRCEEDRWFLELHPTNDDCPGFNPTLKQFGLTPKEKEVCCRVRQGFDNQEIASQLCISFHTAKTHLKNIYRKLDIPNRPRLVSFLNRK